MAHRTRISLRSVLFSVAVVAVVGLVAGSAGAKATLTVYTAVEADDLRRAFDIDVLTCPRCGNQMRLRATIEDPRVVKQLLTHLGLPSERVRADPAQPPPTSASTLFADTLA